MKNRQLVVLAAFLYTSLASAASEPNVSRPPANAAPASAQTNASMTEGEVRKVDKSAKKITLKHGEIKNLDMPPMTMVFQVQDLALLDKVKVGDKVKFSAQQIGGAIVVTAIDVTP